MEKEIKLNMTSEKNIQVFVNSYLKHVIIENQRRISAQEIYNIIDYKIGEKLLVKTINDSDIDSNVMAFFESLFIEICNNINLMDFSENNPEKLDKIEEPLDI